MNNVYEILIWIDIGILSCLFEANFRDHVSIITVLLKLIKLSPKVVACKRTLQDLWELGGIFSEFVLSLGG